MRTLAIVVVTFMLSLSLAIGFASAHVTVLPKETTQSSYEVITIRVPTEKEIATVEVKVMIPEDIEIARFEPKPGWDYSIEKDPNGKIISVDWKAKENGFSSIEFGEFRMQGKIGAETSTLTWNAYQIYADGSTVEWTGAPDSDRPAPTMKVNPKVTNISAEVYADKAEMEMEKASNSSLPLFISIVALIIGLIALALSIRRKSR